MSKYTKSAAALAVIATCLVIANNVHAKLPVAQQAEPTPAAQAAPESEPVPEAASDSACVACCAPQYCITYRQHHVRRRVCCDCCTEPVKTILHIQDPCTCCAIEVPVCVPGCCTDAPCVSTRQGIFGRTITEYSWCCGFRVKIVMTRRGDIVVHTYGA
jgi:hypothetical protein